MFFLLKFHHVKHIRKREIMTNNFIKFIISLIHQFISIQGFDLAVSDDETVAGTSEAVVAAGAPESAAAAFCCRKKSKKLPSEGSTFIASSFARSDATLSFSLRRLRFSAFFAENFHNDIHAHTKRGIPCCLSSSSISSFLFRSNASWRIFSSCSAFIRASRFISKHDEGE